MEMERLVNDILSGIHELVASNANGSTTMEGPLSTDKSAGHSFSLPRREAPRANAIGPEAQSSDLKSLYIWFTQTRLKDHLYSKRVSQKQQQHKESYQEVSGNEHTVFLTGCPCLKEGNVMFYINAMLTPVKKNHLEEKHRWGSGIDSWWEKKKEGWGGISKWALHSVMNQRCFRSCWPFHNSIDSVTGQKKKKPWNEKEKKKAPEVNR